MAVPLTPDLLRPDGMDTDALFARAVALAIEGGPDWSPDGEAAVDVHPLQTPVPEGMRVLRADIPD